MIAEQPKSTAPTPLPKRPFWARVSGAHLLVVAAGILAFLANLMVLRGRVETIPVAVAADDLAAGVELGAEHIRFTEVDASAPAVSGLVNADTWERYRGWIVKVPIPSGTPLIPAVLGAPAATGGRRGMSIPVDVAHAAGGIVSVGDRVDVITVVDNEAAYVAKGLEVVAVPPQERSGFGGIGDYYLVVAVTGDQALAVAEAMAGGKIEVVLSTGAEDSG